MRINNQMYNYKSAAPGNFKGYDARPLKAVVMTISDEPAAFEIVKKISDIGKKDGFDVYYSNGCSKLLKNINSIKKKFNENLGFRFCKWAQDRAVLTPENKVISDGYYKNSIFARSLSSVTKAKTLSSEDAIEGGNLFFINNNGKNEMLLGSEDLVGRNIETIKKMYGVDKIHILPQADYHLDLFYRPLTDNKILIADDTMTLKALQKGLNNLKKYLKNNDCSQEEQNKLLFVKDKLENLIKEFKTDINLNNNYNADDIEPLLKEKGFEPIRVPARIYSTIQNYKRDDLTHSLNYINAVVHQKTDKSLTYITNKSDLNEKFGITWQIARKIGFDFEEMFIKSLAPYVKRRDIHFISGQNNHVSYLLEKEQGGVHCLCNEIPAEIK